MSIEILQSDAKRAVARLAGLNNDELDAIMNDDGKIEAILDGLDQVCIVDNDVKQNFYESSTGNTCSSYSSLLFPPGSSTI